ncbi:hypothetical protein [Zunongwangia endophytica]|uniref:PH domain-containing protein n=1 Tax=Zunongwangia endophytica TaxID=1808945 RepID=A0ABV8HC99_9FLAO|nr:hypothetical protein [Zunongwangia endophytica]MDN3593424.1 hypothetical protein [Zunongwangia endophytica]
MQKIEKHHGFFRRRYYNVFGLLYTLIAFALLFFEDDFSLMYYGYFIIGIAYFVIQYYYGGSTEESISWDSEKIILKKWRQKPVAYSLSEVDHLNISDHHLTIEKGAAGGTMLSLEGFKAEDIQQLQKDFNSEANLQFA